MFKSSINNVGPIPLQWHLRWTGTNFQCSTCTHPLSRVLNIYFWYLSCVQCDVLNGGDSVVVGVCRSTEIACLICKFWVAHTFSCIFINIFTLHTPSTNRHCELCVNNIKDILLGSKNPSLYSHTRGNQNNFTR